MGKGGRIKEATEKIKEHVKNIFAKLDINGDGQLNGKEIAFTKNEMSWMNNMKTVDDNNDRVISQRELYLYLEKDSQKMSFNVNIQSNSNDDTYVIQNLFMNKDTDKDGFITLGEFKKDREEL